MVESRTSRARGRAAAWRPGEGAPAWVWPDSLGGFVGGAAQRITAWAMADVGAGRLVPWLAVSFGFGTVLYFAAEHEPATWAALALAVATIAGAMALRHRPVGFPLMVAAAAIAAGFATATVKRAIIVVGLVLISLVAGFATTLYSAYHFHRLTPYGTLTNLLAMPIVSFWVMPTGIAGVVTLPFGFDGFFWRLMGIGIEWMVAVTVWVASLPGAVGRIAAFGTGPLLLGSAGLVVLGLLKSPLRLAGAFFIAVASVWAIRTPQPDVLVSPDAASFAVRTATGRLSILKTGSDSFAPTQWLAADADARTGKDKELQNGFTCDDAGCVARLADGSIVAIARTPEAFAEDCRRAAVVLSRRNAPPDCAALVIDRKAWQRGGAIALRRVGTAWEITEARPPGYDRPWARARPLAQTSTSLAPTRRNAPRDATPRAEDLQPGD